MHFVICEINVVKVTGVCTAGPTLDITLLTQ